MFHIQVKNENNEWRCWCEVSQIFELGNPREQIPIWNEASCKYINICCSHDSVEDAKSMVKLLNKYRLNLKLQIVLGHCQAPRYPETK